MFGENCLSTEEKPKSRRAQGEAQVTTLKLFKIFLVLLGLSNDQIVHEKHKGYL